MKLSFKVTKDHIAAGKKADRCGCPIALALQEASGIPDVMVSIDTIWVKSNIGSMFNHNVRDFVMRFDAGMEVKPFNYEQTLEYGEYPKLKEIGLDILCS